MRIMVYIHGYPPTHNAGAEWMLYDMIEHLKHEHEITIVTRNAVPGWQQGVTIEEMLITREKSYFADFDAVITHLDWSAKAYNIMQWLQRTTRLYLVVHNTNEYIIARRRYQLNCIYNSIYTSGMNYPQRSVICRPPLVAERYRSEVRNPEYITLVNCWADKGGQVLVDTARLMPEQKFLAVLGGYGEQVKCNLPNVTYLPNGTDMREVYAKTKIYLQPSKYESWGKAACEALCCDIPVICTDTPGLKESMSYAAVYSGRTGEAYKECIEWVLQNYDDRVKVARERTAELLAISADDLKNLSKFLN